jgi:ribosomal protein S18 acetylase RimI-like enzyme
VEAERSGAVLVAEAGGAFAGFAAGWIVQLNVIEETPESNRFGLISDICVPAPYRGHRIASQLLDALSERLCGAGVQRIRLGVLAANHAARAAYERSGFTLYEMVYEKVVGTGGG